MLTIRKDLCLVGCLLLTPAPFGQCQQTTGAGGSDPPAAAPLRADAYGDPLPPGALARLGTVRFRSGDHISAVALTPDGKTLLVGGERTIRLMDTATGRETRRLQVDQNGLTELAVTPDGRSLARAGHSGAIQIIDMTTGKKTGQCGNEAFRATPLIFSGDSRLLAAGSDMPGQQNVLPVWEVATGKLMVQVLPIQNHSVQCALSPDGKILASWGSYLGRGGLDEKQERMARQTIQIWDVATGKELRQLRVEPGVGRAVFSPDGQTLAVAVGMAAIVLVDVTTGQEVRRFAGLQGVGASLLFSADGRTLAAATHDGMVSRWEVATGKRLGVCKVPGGRLLKLLFTPEGRLLACGTEGQKVHLWDVLAEKSLLPTGGHEARVTAVTFMPGGDKVCSADAEGTLHWWDVAAGQSIRQQELRDEESRRDGPGGMVPRAFSPDGLYAVSSYRYSALRLWEVATSKPVCDFQGVNDHELAVAFSADANLLAGAGRGGNIHVWDVLTGKQLHKLESREENRSSTESACVAFSPDGKMLASTCTLHEPRSIRAEIRVWDVATGKALHRISGLHQQGVRCLAFAPDGKTLAAVYAMGAVSLIDAIAGKEFKQLSGLNANLASDGRWPSSPVHFSPSGRLLAYASSEREGGRALIHVIETSTGSPRFELSGHLGQVAALAFSADGRLLATGSTDTTVLLWDLAGRLAAEKSRKGPFADNELDALWAELTHADGRSAWRAMSVLANAATESVPFLHKRLAALKDLEHEGQTAERLLAQLDADTLEQREAATRELARRGAAVRAVLVRALEGKPSAEARRRLEHLLDGLHANTLSGEEVRALRALEVLEIAGTEPARGVLAELATRKPGAALTREAAEALRRWRKSGR